MAIITSWSLTSPDSQDWQAVISAHGVVTYVQIGAPITITPPIFQDLDNPAIVHTPSINNLGVVTLTSGADAGQDRAALLDPNGAQYLAVVDDGIAFFRAPSLRIGDLVTFGLYALESESLIVKSIEPGPDLSARITFVDEAPGVHVAADGAIPEFTSHMTLPRILQAPMPLPRITRIASDESVMLRSTDGSLVPRILISLQLASGGSVPVVHVEVQHRIPNNEVPWERQLFAASSTMELSITSVVESVAYDVRVRTIGEFGQASEWVTVLAHTVIGKTSAPPDVTGLSLNGRQLIWAYPDAPPDLAGFRVRVHVGERTSWGDALPLHDGVISHTAFTLFRDSGKRTYLVKAFDTSGNESALPAVLFVDYGALATANVAEVIDLKALGFPGTLVQGSVIAGNLVAGSDTLFWKTDGLPFWTMDTVIMWPGTFRQMEYTATIIPPLSWLGGTIFIEALVSANGWKIDYAQDGGGPFWSTDASLKMWSSSSSTLFWSGIVAPFVPWTGQLTSYTRQAYQFRLTTFGGNTQGIVSQLAVIFDMPDVVETLTNVLVDVQGTRLTLTKRFVAVVIVSPTVIEDGTVVRALVMDKETTGPLVQLAGASGAFVTGRADFIVRGY